MTPLAPSLQAYFTDRLITQRQASPNTIAAYRHTFRLLLRFAAERTGTPPSELDIARARRAADRRVPRPPRTRPRTTRSRPATTGSRRSTRCSPTSRCTTPSTPTRSQRVLAIPHKRTKEPADLPHRPRGRRAARRLRPEHLDRPPRPRDARAHDPDRPADLRARSRLTRHDITLGTGANVHTIGKGRKQRRTPLTPTTRAVLNAWLAERAGAPDRSAVPDQHRHTSQPRRRRTPPRHPPPRPPPATARRSRPSTSPCTRSGTPPRCGCCSPATTSP